MKEIKGNDLRRHVLDIVYEKKSGHIGASFSIADLVAHLYSNYRLVEGTDKLILSKGHAVPILYAAFYELGLIDRDELMTFREVDSRLQGHPDHRRLPLLHATTGSLGQGLSIAIGHSLAMNLKDEQLSVIDASTAYESPNGKVFCILGDGELQEGQVWEAFMSAPNLQLAKATDPQRIKPSNLVAIVDSNKYQNDGKVDDIMHLRNLKSKISSFGWIVKTITAKEGFEEEFEKALDTSDGGFAPRCIILNTKKAQGVSFMEGKQEWHTKVPSEEEYKKAIAELS